MVSRSKNSQILCSLQALLKALHKPILKIVIMLNDFVLNFSKDQVNGSVQANNNCKECDNSKAIRADKDDSHSQNYDIFVDCEQSMASNENFLVIMIEPVSNSNRVLIHKIVNTFADQ